MPAGAQGGLNFIRLATPTTDDKRLPAVLANTSGFVYYVSITGITGAAAPDAARVARRGRAHQAPHQACRLRSASACETRRRRARSREGADGVVVGSALVEALRADLDADGKATAGTVKAVTDLVAALADGVRAARAWPRNKVVLPEPLGDPSNCVRSTRTRRRGQADGELDELDFQRRPAEDPHHS